MAHEFLGISYFVDVFKRNGKKCQTFANRRRTLPPSVALFPDISPPIFPLQLNFGSQGMNLNGLQNIFEKQLNGRRDPPL